MALDPVINELWAAAIAPSTSQVYTTGFNLFLQFLLMSGTIATVVFPDIQVSEDMLILFVAHCYHKQLSYATIKLYLCGIRFMCLKNNIFYPNNANLNRLHALLGGVKRARVKLRNLRHPITFNILKDICVYLRTNNHVQSFEELMLETACTMAFFGFLRCGEFTVNKEFDHNTNLCVKDLIISDDCVRLHLRRSKTDPFREGVTIKLFRTDKFICPYNICSLYVGRRLLQSPSPDDPLFIMSNQQALSRAFFIERIKHVLECSGHKSDNYNGHSFRIGAATSAAAAHVEDHLIKILGRWSSDAYCRYIRTPQCLISEAQKALTLSQ